MWRAEMFLLFLLLHVFLFPTEISSELEKSRKEFFDAKKCDPNCTFLYDNITIQNIDYFPKDCSTVCADIYITYSSNLTEEKLETTFKNMKHLIGTLDVSQTFFVQGNFLAGLESVETDYGNVEFINNWNMNVLDLSNLTSLNCSQFRITQNPKMTTIKLPNLKNLTTRETSIIANSSKLEVVISSLNSSYCIKFDEMEHFLSLDKGDFSAIYANYCTPAVEDKACNKPEQGCIRFLGDLIIGANFSDFEILKSVESLFGRLIISGSNLTSLDFLANLKYIAPLGWKSDSIYAIHYENEKSKAVQIFNNSKLVDYSLPSLKRIRTDSAYPVTIESNNEALQTNSKACWILQKALVSEHVQVDDDFCFNIQANEDNIQANKERQDRENQTKMMWIAIGVGCAAVLIIFVFFCYCCCFKKKRSGK